MDDQRLTQILVTGIAALWLIQSATQHDLVYEPLIVIVTALAVLRALGTTDTGKSVFKKNLLVQGLLQLRPYSP